MPPSARQRLQLVLLVVLASLLFYGWAQEWLYLSHCGLWLWSHRDHVVPVDVRNPIHDYPLDHSTPKHSSGATSDMSRGAWCPVPEYNHWAAHVAGKTAEVVAVATTPLNPIVCNLIESAIRMGYNMTLLAVRGDTFSKRDKLRVMARYVSLPHLDRLLAGKAEGDGHRHLLLGLDAYDTLVQLSPRELHAKWASGDGDWHSGAFVLSGEANLYPLIDPDHVLFPNKENAPFPFPNSGAWIATPEGAREFLGYAVEKSEGRSQCASIPDDQCSVVLAGLEKGTDVDTQGRLVQSLFPGEPFTGRRELVDPNSMLAFTHDGLLRRTDMDNTPVVIHWNGMTKYASFHSNRRAPSKYDVYVSRGWMRRQYDDGGVDYRFHLSYEQLSAHLSYYLENLTLDPYGADNIMSMCTTREHSLHLELE